MHTTLEHYLKEKNSSVSSWQHGHEIHTLLANIDPSEQELSEFHWSNQASGLSSCTQQGKGAELSRDKDPEQVSKKGHLTIQAESFIYLYGCSVKLLPHMGRTQARGICQILDLTAYVQERMRKH